MVVDLMSTCGTVYGSRVRLPSNRRDPSSTTKPSLDLDFPTAVTSVNRVIHINDDFAMAVDGSMAQRKDFRS